jgi:hypothetical protein
MYGLSVALDRCPDGVEIAKQRTSRFQIPDRPAGPIDQDAGKPRETDDRRFRQRDRRRAVAGILPGKLARHPYRPGDVEARLRQRSLRHQKRVRELLRTAGGNDQAAARKVDERHQFRVESDYFPGISAKQIRRSAGPVSRDAFPARIHAYGSLDGAG